MAVTSEKLYLDLAGLQKYDSNLKNNYIDTAKTLGIKKVLWDETAELIKFYKDPNAVVTDTADFEVSVSSADVQALQTRVGIATDLNDYMSKTDITNILNVLTADNATAGSIAKLLKDAIEALDTEADITVSSVTDGVVTITGSVKENDGIIEKGDATDIVLAKVATTAKAEDVNIAAASGKDEDTNVSWSLAQGTLQKTIEDIKENDANQDAAIATLISDVDTEGSILKSIKDNAKDATYDDEKTIAEAIAQYAEEAVIDVVKQDTAEDGYIATYVIKQNDTQVGSKINIPKDYLVKSSKLIKYVLQDDGTYTEVISGTTGITELPSGVTAGVEYIDFVINTVEGSGNESHIYLDVTTLVNTYTGIDNGSINVAIDSDTYVIQATLDDNAVTTSKILDANVTNDKIATGTIAEDKLVSSVQDKIDTADAIGSIAEADILALFADEPAAE